MSLGESSSAFQSFAGPEEGESVWLVGDLITVKLPAESTDGVLSVVETKTPPGGGPPPHIHHNEDETFYVLEGTVEMLVGEQTIRADEGSSAHVAKGTLHTYKNIGTSPSKLLAVISPGGLEKFFLEAGDSAANGAAPPEGEPDVGRIVELGQEYGLEFPPPPTQ